MTTMLERLSELTEAQLQTLLANAIRLESGAKVTARKAAAELRPAIEAELASRKTTKLADAGVARKAAVKIRKSRARDPLADGGEAGSARSAMSEPGS